MMNEFDRCIDEWAELVAQRNATIAALEQRINDLETNLFAATATVASLENRLAEVEHSRDRLREALRAIADNLRQKYPPNTEMFRKYIFDEDWWTSGRANNDFECWFAERALKEG